MTVCQRSQEGYKSSRASRRGQALLEFALALPILLLVVYGLLEAGRLIFVYAAVATASREAVRYASAAGYRDPDSYVFTYQDCVGIRNRAKDTGFLLNLQDSQIEIYRDKWPSAGAPIPYCATPKTEDTSVTLSGGNRIMVKVTTYYTLLLPLVPFTSRTISSGYTARTFMGAVDLNK